MLVWIESTSDTLWRLCCPSCYSCSHNKDSLIQCLRTNEKTALRAFPSVPSRESRPHSSICYSCRGSLWVIVSRILHRLQHSSNSRVFLTLMTLVIWPQGCLQKNSLNGKLQQQGHAGVGNCSP